MVEVIDGEGVAELLLEAALQQHVEAHHPLLPADQAAPPAVEELEHPVHEDVVRHVEGLVEEVLEGHPVHGVRLLGLLPIVRNTILSSLRKLSSNYIIFMGNPSQLIFT